MLRVPDAVDARARSVGAGSWLERLPAIVSTLERTWSITVGRTYPGGSAAFVAEATREDGSPAVLKVPVPDPETDPAREATVLRLADGDGCPVLYRFDADCGALLMERLGRPLIDLGLPLPRRLEILCATAARVWRSASGSGLPTGAERARRQADRLVSQWEELGRPCSGEALDAAVRAARRREEAHREERAVLVHGDVHEANVLESVDGFTLVDPDGLLAEPEYDLGCLMRGDPIELLSGDPRDRARHLAALTGLDPAAVWDWGLIGRLETGLLCTRIDLQPLGRDALRAADAVAGLAI